ncbi:head-tail connector protein [Pannonibacter phragmitetus]|uniref:head-tail connector protein n=1 Tax=Pannonibacter phragmitetus TaxID=121719 RepID=UPI000F44A081|nr:head-tail connector protein [Pannonibacter phragmitetus]MBA4203373.1 hypothetical protein [Polymorphum sp.]
MTHMVTSPPAVEPVSVAELRAQVRLVHTQEDALLEHYIKAARQHVEALTRRALITQTLQVMLDAWPAGRAVRLPVGPVQDVLAVNLMDGDGVPQPLPSGAWRFYRGSEPGSLRAAPGMGPVEPVNGIQIEFIAGYGPNGSSVPEPLRQAILLLAAHWYENREASVEFGNGTMPQALDRLLSTYRLVLL